MFKKLIIFISAVALTQIVQTFKLKETSTPSAVPPNLVVSATNLVGSTTAAKGDATTFLVGSSNAVNTQLNLENSPNASVNAQNNIPSNVFSFFSKGFVAPRPK